jgi:putative SOS response-associated peptidase YedK
MCGRFVSTSSPEVIAAHFGATAAVDPLGANYNVAPTSDIYAVVETSVGREVQVFHWGLVPVWAKEAKIGQRMINARAETLAEKPAFKNAFRKHRCIVPMDGFYEWKAGNADGPRTKAGKPVKQPVYISHVDGEPLAVAGLTSAWRDPAAGPDAPWLHSANVITTSANTTMLPIHDRMPVLLPPSAWEIWLDPSNHDLGLLSSLLVPAADGLLVTYEVSTDVNSVRNNRADLIVAR